MARAASATGSCWVVALGQHRVEGRDRAVATDAVAGAFDQLRQAREHRGRIAARGRRLADGERDLALRLRVARQGIHQQQHVEPVSRKYSAMLVASMAPCMRMQRRRVGRRRHHHRARHAGFAEDVGSMNSFTSRPRSPISPTT
jgi:hypothetical protein